MLQFIICFFSFFVVLCSPSLAHAQEQNHDHEDHPAGNHSPQWMVGLHAHHHDGEFEPALRVGVCNALVCAGPSLSQDGNLGIFFDLHNHGGHDDHQHDHEEHEETGIPFLVEGEWAPGELSGNFGLHATVGLLQEGALSLGPSLIWEVEGAKPATMQARAQYIGLGVGAMIELHPLDIHLNWNWNKNGELLAGGAVEIRF